MEYKKSDPVHGQLDGRYVTFYQYEFPRATRKKGKFLPLGSVRLREFLYSDGGHGQVVQIILFSTAELTRGSEQRVLVDKMLDISREDKRFKEGILTRQDLSGEVREYFGKKQICLDEILVNQEKIGLFASARRVKDSKRKQRRARHWRIRTQIAMATLFLLIGMATGWFMEKYDLLNLQDNAFYQNYILAGTDKAVELFRTLTGER